MSAQCRVIIKDDLFDLSDAAAVIFCEKAREAVQNKGFFTVAFSGGSTPRGMHRRLAEEPFRSNTPWDKTHIFWVDERRVPENDPVSNYGAVQKDLIRRLTIPKMNIHPMPVHMVPDRDAFHYEKEILAFFGADPGKIPVFDLILLGIGTDGHTASLFPGQAALREGRRLIAAVKGGTPDVGRLTMTYPILNQGREIVFLVSGKGKAGIIQALLEQKQRGLPALGIKPRFGKRTWLLDREAAALLPENIHSPL